MQRTFAHSAAAAAAAGPRSAAARISRPANGAVCAPAARISHAARAQLWAASQPAAKARGSVVRRAAGDVAEEQLLADIQRMKKKEGIPLDEPVAAAEEEGGLKQTIEKVLIADFFFICFALLLLVISWGAKVGMDETGPLDVWLFLWPVVWQPAIGVLMLGSLVVGLVLPKLSGEDSKA